MSEKLPLIVTSNVKKTIKAAHPSAMNTSAEIIDRLSDHVEAILKNAVIRAELAGRKTVMARDLELPVLRPLTMAPGLALVKEEQQTNPQNRSLPRQV